MYQAKFQINNQILKNISQAESARAIIGSSPLVPAYERRFQQEAVNRTVHYGTHLEGNDLSLQEVIKVMEGQKISAGQRDLQEVINYRNVMQYLEELWSQHDAGIVSGQAIPQENSQFHYSEEILKKIHRLTTEKVIDASLVGQYRRQEVTLRNSQTGEIIHRPPPSVEVPFMITDFLNWLNQQEVQKFHPIIKAAIAHYVLVAIHPFPEGNGRVARAFSTLVLHTEGYDIRRLFSLEEYFDRHADLYYRAIQKTDQTNPDLIQRDLSGWIEYFTEVLAIELDRVKEKVLHLSADYRLKRQLGGKQIPLSDRQIKLVEYMREFGGLRMPDAQELLPMVSDDTIWRDLKKLIESKIVGKRGSTKGAYYHLIE